jgi:hypothetical protein
MTGLPGLLKGAAMTRKERRRATRTYSSVPLDLFDPVDHVLIGEGKFLNVSLTGSQLESRQPLPLRKSIHLQVQAPGTFGVAGKIMWRKKKAGTFTYGIRFEPVTSLRHSFKEVA